MIKIDIDTRCWQIPKEEAFLGVESDDKVKILQFELSKNEFFNGLNFTDCNCFINYKNEDNDTIPYGITDMEVQEDGTVTFTWKVSRGATIFKGNTFAVLCAKKVRNDGTITNEWNSRIGSFIVAKGLEPSSSISEVPEIDIISQLLLVAQQTNANAQNNINQSSQLLEKAEGLAYLKEEYDVLEARMNQFTSLKEGSTTGDAELQDIRVGADGKTYDTAGDAVRGQIGELKSDLANSISKKTLAEPKNMFNPTAYVTIEGKQLNYFNAGIPSYKDNGSVNTVFMPINGNQSIAISLSLSGYTVIIAQVILDGEVYKQTNNTSVMYLRSDSPKIFTTNALTTHLLISLANKIYGNLQVEKGTVVTDFEPYFPPRYCAILFDGLDTEKSLEYFEKVDELEQKVDDTVLVNCWGDSLTWGAGAEVQTYYTKYTYPGTLQRLLGEKYTVKNYGVGGENAPTIAGRQGGLPYIVQPFTIPSDTSLVEVTIKSLVNGSVTPFKQNDWNTGLTVGESEPINPCIIDGVVGKFTCNSEKTKYYFQRAESGESKVITRPTPLLTNAHVNKRDSVQIIWIGTNGGYSSKEELVHIVDMMVQNTGLLQPKFIVIGLTYTVDEELERLYENKFGRHFLNVREYITTPIYENESIVSCYGMDDENITPTEQDLQRISQGLIPKSLLNNESASDYTHFNVKGYNVIANQIYKRGIELRYW